VNHTPESAHAAEANRARHATSLALAALLTAGLLIGCGSSSNGITARSATEILQASEKAVSNASSVTIKGQTAQRRLVSAVELMLTRSGGQGKVSLLGINFEVKRLDGTIYLKGNPSFYKRLGITQSIPANTWIKAPANQLSQLGAFTDLTGETGRLIATAGKVTKGQTTRIEGQPVIELKTEGKVYKGRLYVKTTGEPYPVRLEKTGRETTHVAFSAWNATPAPTAPANTTTISR
jgi:hypothetical protein